MNVKLPRGCTGQEILDAFAAATEAMKMDSDSKLEVRWEEDDHQYRPGSVKLVVTGVRAIAKVMQLKKRFGFFGEKVWKESGLKIEFGGINPAYTYRDVGLSIQGRRYNIRSFRCEELPEGYENDRPFVEKFLQAFYDHLLKPQQQPA